MKKKEILEVYKSCMKTGILPAYGLCETLNYNKILELFEPTYEESEEYNHWHGHWGCSNEYEDDFHKVWEFNEFRQTVMLFLAEMSNEL